MKFQPLKYYADDKDVHDILSSSRISSKKLLVICRERGIFLSDECTREEVVHYMSMLPFSWSQIQEVMAEIESEDRDEKLTTCQVTARAQMEDMEQAAQKIRETRGEIRAENFDVIQRTDGRLDIKVRYTEPDFQRARLIQRREREAVIEVQKKGDAFEFRHTQNERTNEIVSELLAALTPPDAPEKPVRRTIELSGIKNHEQRTKFFLNLFGGMEGFQLREVRDLKVDRLAEESGSDAEGEDDLQVSEDELKALVRKVALFGENILLSPQYQQLAQAGFFISRAVWTSMETSGNGRLFEFEAEFKDSENATDFAYQVRGVYERDQDGQISQTRAHVGDAEKNQLRSCLESAAYESLDDVTPKPPKS
jgi:hypothetical protein